MENKIDVSIHQYTHDGVAEYTDVKQMLWNPRSMNLSNVYNASQVFYCRMNVFLMDVVDISINVLRVANAIIVSGIVIYTEILEVNLFAFVYRLFHDNFSPIYEALS